MKNPSPSPVYHIKSAYKRDEARCGLFVPNDLMLSTFYYMNYVLSDPERYVKIAKVCLKCRNKISPLEILAHTDL